MKKAEEIPQIIVFYSQRLDISWINIFLVALGWSSNMKMTV